MSSAPKDLIRILGASANTLTDISVEIPRAALTVVTGVSGAGKTTLLRDVLFREWRNRVERQGGRARWIEGLPPVIYLGRELRRTGDVLSESGLSRVFEYLAVSLSRHVCPTCNEPLVAFELRDLIEQVSLLAPPLIVCGVSDFSQTAELLGRGYSRILKDGELARLEAFAGTDLSGEMLVAVDLMTSPKPSRLQEALRLASELSPEEIVVRGGGELIRYPLQFRCATCRTLYSRFSARHFRRRSESCVECRGKGCVLCYGTGLGSLALGAKLFDLKVEEVLTTPVQDLRLKLIGIEKEVSGLALRAFQIFQEKLLLLETLDLGYLHLARRSMTLSSGELQRVRLAKVLSEQISGALIALDEPTSSLHPKNARSLLEELDRQVQRGNTIVCATHDQLFIEKSEARIELAPSSPRSYSSGTPVADTASRGEGEIVLEDLRFRNLKNLSIRFPLGRLVLVSGVSGSGKSTLLFDVLAPWLKELLTTKESALEKPEGKISFHGELSRVVTFRALRHVRRGLSVLQRLGLLTPLRKLYAQVERARIEGLKERDFTFSAAGPHARVLYRGRAFPELLSLSVQEAYEHFERIPMLRKPLERAVRLGLGYLILAQRELSEGEEKRILLSRVLEEKHSAKTLFLLDEPLQSLHPSEQSLVLNAFAELLRRGNSLIVIEHATSIAAAADLHFELGPGGGEAGGEIIAAHIRDG